MMDNRSDVLIEPNVGKSRLMGPNLFFSKPGAVLDATLNPADMRDINQIVDLWYKELNRVMAALNWRGYQAVHDIYSNGIKFAITAPDDLLFVAAFSIREIWDSVYRWYKTGSPTPLVDILNELVPDLRRHLDLKFRVICDEARRRSLNVFHEKYDVCIGSGVSAYRCDIDDVVLEDIPWNDIKEIPTVIVTGTNGKTTTVRLTAYIIRHAQRKVGYCSTDWVVVGDQVVETGDMSGPTGNLRVMVNSEVEIAVLEAARGGLVRRGLIVDFVSAATVTNISEDHLGQDGIETIEDLARAKCLVYQAVRPDGYCIINIDDKEIYKRVFSISGQKIIITQRALTNVDVAKAINEACYVCYTRDNTFYWKTKDTEQLIATYAEVPITANGNALHNVENTMHAICLSFSLGLTIEEIRAGITTYENTVANNRGRANVFKYNGATIIVDFAHNPAAMSAILNMCKAYKASDSEFSVLVGNTGNRLNMTDNICQSIVDANVDKIMIKEIPNFLRGAKLGEIPKMLEDSLLRKGVNKNKIMMIESEENALTYILSTIKSGDVCAFLCHSDTGKIIEALEEHTKSN